MNIFRDLKNPRWIILKGWLFLLILVLSATALVLETPHWRTALLVGFVTWSAARFYYFLFYVIEHYVDSRFRFSGVITALLFLVRRKKHHQPQR